MLYNCTVRTPLKALSSTSVSIHHPIPPAVPLPVFTFALQSARHRIPHFPYTMPINISFRKNKQRAPDAETVKIVTMEDLFTFISDSQRNIKEKREANIRSGFDISAHDGDDVDAGVNADDDAGDSDDDEPMVRVHDSDYRSDSTDNIS